MLGSVFQWISQLSRAELYFIGFLIFVALFTELLATLLLIASNVRQAARINRCFEETIIDIETIRADASLLEPIKEEAKRSLDLEHGPGKMMERLSFPRSKISSAIIPLDIDVTDTESIKRSIEALSNKYFLESVTITSDDGLVIASSSDKAEEEAAEFSFMFQEAQKIRHTSLISLSEVGAYICSINTRENPLICIIKSKEVIESNRISKIRNDAEALIERWVLKSAS